MAREYAGNHAQTVSFNRVSDRLASAFRLATLGVALAASLATAGCIGLAGAPPGTNGSAGGGAISGQASQLSPSSSDMAFGNVTVGSSTSQLVTLTVAGTKNVMISKVTASGSGFAVSPKSNVLLAPNQSVTVSVSFEPKLAGRSAGSLIVSSDASNSTLQISLSGDGLVQAQAAGHSVALSWQASKSAVVGYFVFRGTKTSGMSRLNPDPVPSTSYTDTAIRGGQTYVYAVKSIDSSNMLSDFSNVVTVKVPDN